MKTLYTRGFVRFVIVIAFAISTAMLSGTAFGQQTLETVNVERATVVISHQCELARTHNDSPNASAFGEALNVLNGTISQLSVDARNRIAIARNRAMGDNQTEIAQSFEVVLLKCGVPVSDTTQTASVATMVTTTSPNGSFHSGEQVDRCDYMIKRGSRIGHVCGRSKAEHIHLGEFYFCPDELCQKCGKSAQVHFWEEGNGLLCHIHTEEVVGMVRQTNLPAVMVVGKVSVLKLTTSSPIVIQEKTVVVKTQVKEDNCKYKGRANPAVPKRDP